MDKDLVEIKRFGDIKEKRLKLGKSQVDVAKYCGVSTQTFYRWETGLSKKFERGYANKLCEILEISVTE